MPEPTDEPMDEATDETMDGPTDATSEEPVGGPIDDQLAARIRGALDDRVAPVRLDEITGPARPASTAGAAAGGGLRAVDRPTEGRHQRRPLLVLAAAAVVVVLVGVAAVLARPDSRTVETVLEPSGDPPVVRPVPAAGGVYDPAAGVLRSKRVTSMVADERGRVYLGYTDSSDVDPLGTADPSGAGRGFTFGLLVVDGGTGAVIADHALPGSVVGGATAGADLWFTTRAYPSAPVAGPGSMHGNLWRLTDGGSPQAVDDLAGEVDRIAASDSGVWLRANELQRRDPATGAVLDVSGGPWGSGALVATADEGLWVNADGGATVVPVDGVTPGTPIPVGSPGSEPNLLAVSGGSVFVAQGKEVVRIDIAAGAVAGRYPLVDTVMALDGRGERAWAVARNPDHTSARIEVAEIDGRTGESRTAAAYLPGAYPRVAALDRSAMVCTELETVVVADPPTGTSLGSDCLWVPSPFAPIDPSAPPTTEPSPQPVETVATTDPVIGTIVTTTVPQPPPSTTPVGPSTTVPEDWTIEPTGIGPVRLGMTVEELLASPVGRFESMGPVCGDKEIFLDREHQVRAHVQEGTVFAVQAVGPATATSEGVRVGMAPADLEARLPGLEHYGNDETGGQYAQRRPSGGIYFSHHDGAVASIIAIAWSDGWVLDLC